MKILVANAWPYANGSLHIGHIAALLPGDVLARYHRQRGDTVYFVSGSDCHGTPVTIRARQEGKTPAQVSDHYHEEFTDVFGRLGFKYDLYGKTSQKEHTQFVQAFHKKMYAGGYIEESSAPQAYCTSCQTHLVDRLVQGLCPNCKNPARGDQCEICGQVLEPENLLNPRCSLCGSTPSFIPSTHLYLSLTKLEPQLRAYIESHPSWRKNARSFSQRYLSDGLKDRAITRNLSWGIDVPRDGYEDKRIYIWAENVLGYLSMSAVVAEKREEPLEELWGSGSDIRHYYVHGKDNIPFHSIILPALLLANGGKWRLPDEIVSSEYMTLEGRKISTSANWAVWAKDLLERYHPDSIRYFLITNGPQRRDTDFSFREFILSHNAELLGAYGNFINRSLQFIYKYLGARIPQGRLEPQIGAEIEGLYDTVGAKIEGGDFKGALDRVFEFVHTANQYFDAQKPWETRFSDPESCDNTLYNCAQIAANLAVLLEPFLPRSSIIVRYYLYVDNSWNAKTVPSGQSIPSPEPLFEKIDKEQIAREEETLKGSDGRCCAG